MKKKTKYDKRYFIETGEIIRLAGVHPHTVVNWRYTRRIVPIYQLKHRVGTPFLYDRKAVMKFLKRWKAGEFGPGKKKKNKKKKKKGRKEGERGGEKSL